MICAVVVVSEQVSQSWTEGLPAFEGPPVPAKGSLKNILLVEDNPADAALIRAHLRRGFPEVTPRTVVRLSEAIELLREEPFDLVMLDLNLPDSNGLQTVRGLLKQIPEVPVVVLTGLDDEAMAAGCLAAGAQDYIPKSEMATEFLKRVVAQALYRKRAEQNRHKVAHINRLAFLGKIAAGVAHELNNPATVVMAYLDLTRGLIKSLCDLGDTPLNVTCDPLAGALKELSDDIDSAAEGVGAMVAAASDLQSFSRTEDEPRALDLGPLIKKALRLLPPEGRLQCKISLDLAQTPQVVGRSQRLLQVIINLLTNAIHAVENNRDRAKEIFVVSRVVGEHAVIRVIDNGCGMSEPVRRRVFEAFYTTRPLEGGTGLGLALAQDFVNEMGGTIACRSEEGVGTQFELRLPIEVASQSIDANRKSGSAIPARRLRVLLVDDDRTVLNSLCAMLKSQFDVVGVDSPEAALLKLGEQKDFDMMVADHNMPNMTGLELYESVCQSFPKLAQRFVLISGVDLFANPHTDQKRPPAFLGKPFTAADLMHVAENLYQTVRVEN